MWRIATGAHSRRYPYWVTDGGRAAENDAGNVRRFASAETAQRYADRLNRRDYGSAEMLSARRHLAAAVRMLTRATRDASADDPRIAIASALFDHLQGIGGAS